ncbi:MAG: ERAP1-like C-terminal domain-containing protein [Myxococcales bacterium]|nr:MAG: ERAP1-like C-terminal domain-containing protein [Myxococcales bacterium]
MPNEHGAGYYRWRVRPSERAALSKLAWRRLDNEERVSFGESLRAGFSDGSIEGADVLDAFVAFGSSNQSQVAQYPMALLDFAARHMLDESQFGSFQNYADRLYGRVYRKLGWKGKTSDENDSFMRRNVVRFLALVSKDPKVRKQAVQLANSFLGFETTKDKEAKFAPELREVVLKVAVQEQGEAFFSFLEKEFVESQDALYRQELLAALSVATNQKLAERARNLALGQKLRANEKMIPLYMQMAMPELRDQAWDWVKKHYDELVAKLPEGRAGQLPLLMSGFCSTNKAEEIGQFFENRIHQLLGGPRNLAAAIESTRLCEAQVKRQGQSVRAFFD